MLKLNLLGFLIISIFPSVSQSFNCYEHICHECSYEEIYKEGELKQCSLRKLISEHAFDQIPILQNYPPERDVDFACLKMTATVPNTMDDTTDVIKGCALRSYADVMCKILTSVEHARGKIEAKCVYCYGDSCNNSITISSSGLLLLLLPVIMLIK